MKLINVCCYYSLIILSTESVSWIWEINSDWFYESESNQLIKKNVHKLDIEHTLKCPWEK